MVGECLKHTESYRGGQEHSGDEKVQDTYSILQVCNKVFAVLVLF